MPRYVLAFHGGATPATPEEGELLMAAWSEWMQSVGPSLLDPGAPTGAWRTVTADGSVTDSGGPNPVTGYTIVEAADFDAVVALTEGNPIFNAGGSIEILEMADG